MHETIQSSSQLEYIIQLHLDGFEDARTSTTPSDLIQRLRSHRAAWLALTPHEEKRHIALDMKYPCEVYELVGGAFANINKYYFEIAWLPTVFNPGNTPLIQRTPSDIPIASFAMDPTQDLIVLLEADTT